MTIVVFFAFLLVLVLIELIYYGKHAMEDLDLDVRFSKPVAGHGEMIEVIEVAQNNKKMRLPFVLLKFEAPTAIEFQDMTNTSVSDLLYREDMLSMKPFSRHTRKIKAKCIKRGYYTFPRITISSTDLLFIEKLSREFPNDATLTILPQRLSPDEIRTLLSITFSDIQQRRTLLTDPFSFAGIREYQPWDPMKSVNWTASAKVGDYMVNQNASTSTKKVTVFLNLDFYNQKRSMPLLEKSISLAFTYLCELSEEGIPTLLFSNGVDTVTKSPVVSEQASVDVTKPAIDLARVDLNTDRVSFIELIENNIGSTGIDDLIVIISPRSDSNIQNYLIDLKQRRTSMKWVIPTYKSTPLPPLDAELSSNIIKWEVSGHD